MQALRSLQIKDRIAALLAGKDGEFVFELRNTFEPNLYGRLRLCGRPRRVSPGKWELKFTTSLTPREMRHRVIFERLPDRLSSADIPLPLLREMLARNETHPGL